MSSALSTGLTKVHPCTFSAHTQTTGIGKSMLGYLLLYRWACDKQRILVLKHGLPNILLCESGAYTLSLEAARDELGRDGIR
jgi:hypothetical protein